MKHIEVNKDNLVRILKKNRTKHIKEFKETKEGYLEDVEEWLREQLRNLEQGTEVEINFEGETPQSHEEEYNRIIGMLEMDVDSTVNIDAVEYEKYINDKWNWTRSFSHSNSMYSKAGV